MQRRPDSLYFNSTFPASLQNPMIPILNVSDFIDALTKYSPDWIVALLPWVGAFIGISLAFIILRVIVEAIQEHFDWEVDKENLLADKRVFQELLGAQSGATAFERWRLFSDMSKGMQRFIVPRDMRSGVSLNDLFTGPTGQALTQMYPQWRDPSKEYLNPEEFKRKSFWQKIKDYRKRENYEAIMPILAQSEAKKGYQPTPEELENYMENLAEDKSGGVEDIGRV